MRIRVGTILLGAAILCGGCGVTARTDFPNALTNESGEVILLDDVTDILSDPDLSEDQQRAALRELGLEDERLIDALVES